MLNCLGPAGWAVAIAGIIAFISIRRTNRVLLAMPLISVTLLGVGKILYPDDRFYTIICLALVPLVAAGLGALIENHRLWVRRGLVAVLSVGALLNGWFAIFVWLYNDSTFELVAERHAIAHASRQENLY